MSAREDGGPAFSSGDPIIGGWTGMSLRDYFAGQALAGWLASFGPDDVLKEAIVAEQAYALADAMIEARAK